MKVNTESIKVEMVLDERDVNRIKFDEIDDYVKNNILNAVAKAVKESERPSFKDLADITRKYLVTMDGYRKYYGSYVDFVGLFNTRDEAEKAIDECLKYAESLEINIKKEDYKIFEVDEGWWYYPHQDNISDRYETVHTDMPLGGYEE